MERSDMRVHGSRDRRCPGNACRDVDLEISACPDRLDARQRRTLGDLPSPLWGGVGGGGSSWRTHLMKQLLPPSPPLPQRKSGLPDLRKIKPRPEQARGAWGGSRPRLPHELIPFQRDTAQRKFKAVPSPLGRILRARWLVDNPRLSEWSRDTIWRESPRDFQRNSRRAGARLQACHLVCR